jgi:hypothetical protein
MADIKAIASGNWSSTATWQGGVIPGPNDTAISNNFIVTINQDISVQRLSNSTYATSTAGGYFQVTTVGAGVTRNISFTTASLGAFYIGAANLLTISATSGTVNILFPNNPTNSEIQGGFNSSNPCVLINGPGITVNIDALNINSGGNAASPGVSVTAVCNVTVKNITNNSNANGMTVSAAATITTGSIRNTQTGSFTGGHGLNVSAPANITVNGDVTASYNTTGFTGGGAGINLTSGAFGVVLTCNGAVTASEVSPAIYAASTSNTFGTFVIKGPFNFGFAGRNPLLIPTWRVPPNVELEVNMADDISYLTNRDTVKLTKSPVGPYPNAADVREATSYNGVAGSLIVPSTFEVAYGVPVGIETGQAVLTQEDVSLSEVSDGVSLATKLLNSATVDSVGTQIAALQG